MVRDSIELCISESAPSWIRASSCTQSKRQCELQSIIIKIVRPDQGWT